MANRSNIIFETLEFFEIGAPDIVMVFVGCLILIFGALLVIGFWPRVIALVLLILLAIGGYCWLPQASQLNFQIEALYGVLLFYLVLVGGGQWAVSRRRYAQGQSVLESEHSILVSDDRPSIFKEDEEGETILTPPVVEKVTEEEDEVEEEKAPSYSEEQDDGEDRSDREEGEDRSDREEGEDDADEDDEEHPTQKSLL